jgi:broad specificity phosphatase PhoE
VGDLEALPTELVFIRHGESEENFAFGQDKKGESLENIDAPYGRPNWKHRLDNLGIEQALAAKLCLMQYMGGLATFSALYVSPYLRARETAAYLGNDIPTGWIIDDRIGEREWGEYGETPSFLRDKIFPRTKTGIDNSRFWTRHPGGENVPDINYRLNSFFNMLSQKHASQKVLAVTHGGIMRAVRYNIEQMRPEEYEEAATDPEQEIRNCTILCYSRLHPFNKKDIRPEMTWRRIIYPGSKKEPPHCGEWVELRRRRTYTNEELREQLKIAPNLLKHD